jgi:hypothetical protein
VCGRPGALSGDWRQATEQEVARLGQEAQDAEDLERAAAQAKTILAMLRRESNVDRARSGWPPAAADICHREPLTHSTTPPAARHENLLS